MKILALDTTTKKASVAIKINNDLYIKSIDNEITHSEKLLPLIDEMLKIANIKLNDIDLLACTLGPGSFTGVRIGISTLKAIGKVINKNIIGITSLKLLAINALKQVPSKPTYVLSLMDAKNSRAYYSLYKLEGKDLIEVESGNDYIEKILLNYSKNDKMIICQDTELLLTHHVQNLKVITSSLDLSLIFDDDFSKDSYTYLTLDAMYYRKSEAERTKDGE